ncbi:DUF4114 domain-containing protein [Aquimarina sp. M1]
MKRTLLLQLFLMTSLIVWSQNYNYLGTYNEEGVPDYLLEDDVVTQALLDSIAAALPEGFPVPDYNPHYISSGYDTDIILEENADVWVTFVGEGAGYKNVLGFYTYDPNNPPAAIPTPEEITIVFPNVSKTYSGGGLEPGNKVKIGTFAANTGIGWVLLADAWSNGSVGYGNWQLFSNPDYNPEADESLRYHNVLLSDPENERIILGFEDIRRDYGSCDNDFNDALFYVTANPFTAIKSQNLPDITSATDVTSANDGGLESNGDLASLIAQRNFNRTKSNIFFNTKKSQKKFQPDTVSNKSNNNEDLSFYFPTTGVAGSESTYVSSPEDLLGITNANTVFSVDYYQNEKRVAAGLATTTTGRIYDHSKTICDRLNGSRLLDLRTVKIRNHTIISTRIERATGEIEYALTFSIKEGALENEIYSLWNIDSYPEGDYTNFQIWGGSVSQVANIANHILDTFISDKPMRSHEVSNRIPTTFVEKGRYDNGKLVLDIVNKSGASWMNFDGNIRRTEQSSEMALSETVALSGAYREQIKVETGFLFDIGFSINGEEATQIDALYLADGPWGIDYREEAVVLDTFEVLEQIEAGSDEQYTIERGVAVSGDVKETMNVFRNVLAGDLTLSVENYNALQFKMSTTNDIEVILVTKDLTDWHDRLRFTLEANSDKTLYNIAFADFKNAADVSIDVTDIKSVVFSLQGDYQNFLSFDVEITELVFASNTVLNTEEYEVQEKVAKVMNYPNPFQATTFIRVPETLQGTLMITVVDMLGRIVRNEELQMITNNEAKFDAKDLSSGVYKYIVSGSDKKKYWGSFMKE